VRLRLDISYDGTDFCGWARQPGLRSVQGELESALRAAVRIPADLPARVAVAGRTDAGVHATGQVCHADVPRAAWDQLTGHSTISAEQIVHRRINGLLPADVRVRRLRPAADGFHARWSASWRQYRYLVADRPAVQDPRTRGYVFWCRRELDVEAMAAAAAPFLGEHDFAAFCRARPGTSSVRTVHEISWSHSGHGGLRSGEPSAEPGQQAGSLAVGPVQFTIRSDAFCHSMVRSLVGAFLEVGQGRWPQDRPRELLVAGVRVPAIPSAPARGLTLIDVGYPADAQLADQARTNRRYRGR
jgi:tRNA pseudouridine38-40 synthase